MQCVQHVGLFIAENEPMLIAPPPRAGYLRLNLLVKFRVLVEKVEHVLFRNMKHHKSSRTTFPYLVPKELSSTNATSSPLSSAIQSAEYGQSRQLNAFKLR